MNDTALAKYSNPSLEDILTDETLFYRTFRVIGGQPAITTPNPVIEQLQAVLPNWEHGPGYVVWAFDNWKRFRETALYRLQNPAPTAIQPRATEHRPTAPLHAPPLELAQILSVVTAPRSGGSQPPQISINISGSFNQTVTNSHNRKSLRYHQEETRRVTQVKPSAVVAPFFFFLWLFAMMALIVGGGSNNGR